jgi:GMP synthase (glutamine-hydrolysing)
MKFENRMKTALALRHVAFEDLGCLEPILRSHGFTIDYVEIGVTPLSEMSPLDADLVIVLGGPISAYDLDHYPFLRTEIAWLRARMIEDLPTLGICLGAQLMAAALNAKVYPGAAGKEIGWSPLKRGADTAELPYFDELLCNQPQVLHWHGDTFDLPEGAKHLAASDRYVNQAFSWGRNCLALQFHPEFDVGTIEQWLIGHAHEISHTRNVSLPQLRATTRQHGPAFQAFSSRFWNGWLGSLRSTRFSSRRTRPDLEAIF